MNSQRVRVILREGERFETPSLTLVVVSTPGSSGQVACVVGKKVHKSAVVRHRYQRLMRAALAEVLKKKPAYDMVVMAKPTILSFSKLADLQRELDSLLNKFLPNSKLKT